jgi:hypothetical protein
VKRRLFNLLAAVSLVLCVATVALWVRSFCVGDQVNYYTAGLRSRYSMGTIRQNFVFSRLDIAFSTSIRALPKEGWSYSCIASTGAQDYPSPQAKVQFLGLAFERIVFARSFSLERATVPIWMVLMLFVMPVGGWLILHKSIPKRSGLCQRCGYDLRASKDRCPECGSAIPAGGGERA